MTNQTAPLNVTKLEHAALKHAFKSADGNGHDFGFVEDIVKGLRPMKAQAVGAVVSSLVKKDIITVHEPVTTDSGTFTQFTWGDDATLEQVKSLIAGPALVVSGPVDYLAGASHPLPALPVPRVVVTDKTRYSLVVREEQGVTHILTRIITETRGFFDIIKTPTSSIGRLYPAASEVEFPGHVAPTPAHFLDVASRSHLDFSTEAVQYLKELQMSTIQTVIISKTGKLLTTANPQAIILTSDKPLKESLSILTTQLGERALAAVVTNAFKMPKPLATIAKDDERIEVALKSLLMDNSEIGTAAAKATKSAAKKTTGGMDPGNAQGVQASGKDGKVAAKKTAKPVGEKKVSSKAQIHAHLVAGNASTFDELVKMTGASEGSVRTALTDLKNEKYAKPFAPIAIAKDADGKYFVPTPAQIKAAVVAAEKAEKAAKVEAEKLAKAAAKGAKK